MVEIFEDADDVYALCGGVLFLFSNLSTVTSAPLIAQTNFKRASGELQMNR